MTDGEDVRYGLIGGAECVEVAKSSSQVASVSDTRKLRALRLLVLLSARGDASHLDNVSSAGEGRSSSYNTLKRAIDLGVNVMVVDERLLGRLLRGDDIGDIGVDGIIPDENEDGRFCCCSRLMELRLWMVPVGDALLVFLDLEGGEKFTGGGGGSSSCNGEATGTIKLLLLVRNDPVVSGHESSVRRFLIDKLFRLLPPPFTFGDGGTWN